MPFHLPKEEENRTDGRQNGITKNGIEMRRCVEIIPPQNCPLQFDRMDKGECVGDPAKGRAH